MNLIPYIPLESMREISPECLILYVILLTDCTSIDGEIISKNNVGKLEKMFVDSEYDVADILTDLAQVDFIKFSDSGISVGWGKSGSVSLYSSAARGSIDYSDLDRAVSIYIKYAGGNMGASNCKRKLEQLKEIPVHKFTGTEVASLYKLSFEAYGQVPARNLTGAEYGKLSFLCKTYDVAIVANMIIHYFANAEVYCRGTSPTIGLLLYHKDTIRARIKSKVSSTGEDSFQEK